MRNTATHSKIRLGKVVKTGFSKPFISAVIFALALWVYTSLNQEYRANINIPLKINLPATRAFINPPPENITVNVKGSGWHIFNSQFNNSAYCNIDLSKAVINTSVYEVYRDQILKNIQNQNWMYVNDVYPDYLKLVTGKISDTSIKIVPNIVINPKEGYTLVGDIQLKPDLVFISGNDEVIREIKTWSTKAYNFEDVFTSINTIVELSDSLKGVINIKSEPIKLIADIQQTAEVVIPDVQVKIIGSNLMKNHRVAPMNLQVTVRGGINLIKNLSPDQVTAYIDYQQIINDSTGYIKPSVQVPDNLNVINVSPKYLYHKIKY